MVRFTFGKWSVRVRDFQNVRTRVLHGCSPAIAMYGLILLVGVNRSSIANAADVTSTWSAATSGSWNLNANWTNVPALGGFPNNGNGGVATYDAVVSAVGSPYIVTVNAAITVEDLVLNSASATVSHTAGTFAATGAIALAAGTYQVSGGTISNTTVNATGGTLTFISNNSNLLTGVTVNGDLTFNSTNARSKIDGGTTFNTAHLAAQNASLGFAPGQTLASTILFEGASNDRFVEMNGSAGTFTVGPTGIIRTAAGFGGDVKFGAGFWYSGAMTLMNQGLISNTASGRTVTVNPSTLTNAGTGILEVTNGGILTIGSANWSNAGNLRALTGSTANLNGAWSNLGGTFAADATSTLNFGGSFSTTNLGTLSLAAGSKVKIPGTWDNSGQTFTFNTATGSWTLAGGAINGGTLAFADGQTLIISNSSGLLNGVTVNGDLNLSTIDSRVKLASGTTFNTAHLSGSASSIGVAPGYTLASTILFEGAAFAPRAVEMNGTSGTFTVGPTGVIRTVTGLGVDVQIGGTLQFGGTMTLLNQGLISSQVSAPKITIPGSFSNAGTLEAINGGNLVVPLGYTQSSGVTRLSGGGTINVTSGPTTNTITIAGGRLEATGTINANVANSSTIAPGTPTGTLGITGDLTLAASSNLEMELGGKIQGSGYDFIQEVGNAALNLQGVLSLALTGGFTPAAADSLIILSSNQTITGAFSNVTAGHVLASDGITSLRVSVIGKHVVVGQLPGDYTGNGVVDAADYVVWRKGLGTSYVQGHYDIWRASFGQTAGTGSGDYMNAAVPEPATLVLVIVAAAGIGMRRRQGALTVAKLVNA